MIVPSYTYSFGPIGSNNGSVEVTDHAQDARYRARLSVKDSQLFSRVYWHVPSIHADLLDIAVAVHTVDRLSRPRSDCASSLKVTLPVRNRDFLSSEAVCKQLERVLFWYTNDYWEFDFIGRDASGRLSEIQYKFPMERSGEAETEVALWSGGLDSLAGLYHRLKQLPSTNFILVGAGSSTYVHRKQISVANLVKQVFPERIELLQVPYYFSSPQIRSRNRTQRSRGFVFLVVGAVCAHLNDQNSLYVYENGIGAINLPYRASEVGLDHSRSVNPISLFKMSDLLSTTLNTPFQIRNPYIFWTKAELCRSLVQDGRTKLVLNTTTCDRPQRITGRGILQCGACSSCLLRRQALAALDFEDPTHYAHNGWIELSDETHLRAMLSQVEKLRSLLNREDAWRSLLQEYHDLSDIADYLTSRTSEEPAMIQEKLVLMYTRYVEEWDIFQRQGLPVKEINKQFDHELFLTQRRVANGKEHTRYD